MYEKINVELLDVTEFSELKIVSIAKLSHGANIHKVYSVEEVRDFINKLLSWKHFSVFEHAIATFYIENISLNCSHQLVRHRLFSFLQKSRRYCSDNPKFVMPEKLNEFSDEVKDLYKKSNNLYNKLLKNDIAPEDARFVLPTSLTTNIVVTGNFRQFFHFFKLRLDKSAQWEIRKVAELMFEKLNKVSPNIFKKENLKYFE